MAETLLMFNQEDQAWEHINVLEREVKTLQEYQIAVPQIDALLAQAKLDFDNHLFSFAFENAKRGIETAKQVMIDYSRASEEYSRCQALIQQVSTIGDPSSLLDSLMASEQDFANSDFKAAIEKCLESLRVGTEILRNATPQFEVEVLSKDIKPKTWNRVRFRVHNTGKVHASDVHTNCIGQVEVTVTPSAHVIPAGGCADIDMGINPPGEGEIPLELKVSAVARNTGKRCEISVPFWMMVGGSQDTQGRPAKAVRDFFSIDEIFLIYRDGRLILHHSVKGTTDLDDTVLSGMMVAMQNFVSDSFKAGGGLRRFTFDKYTIAMEKGNYVFLATVLEGRPPPELYETILDTIERLEMAYAGVIEEWDGATDRFKDATAMFEDVLSLSKRFGMDEAAELGVRIKSGLEFFRGFVRLKVGILNETDETTTDGALLLTFNRKAMRLVKIEPEYEFEGSTVYIGTLHPKEKKTIAFYLDPLICQESTVDCTFNFMDARGRLNHIDMKRRPVDIVCPLFYTPQTLNIAMLKRLLGDLKEWDVRGFAVPAPLDVKKVFDTGKDVVQGHDVRFVRDLFDKDDGGHDVCEAWYYGKTQATSEEVIIRVSAEMEPRKVKLLVASNNLAATTGLLAELAHHLSNALPEARMEMEGTDIERSKISLLLDKLSESEAAPGELGETQ